LIGVSGGAISAPAAPSAPVTPPPAPTPPPGSARQAPGA
jgi:hypothetical protein